MAGCLDVEGGVLCEGCLEGATSAEDTGYCQGQQEKYLRVFLIVAEKFVVFQTLTNVSWDSVGLIGDSV